MLTIVNDLLDGREHDRRSIADRVDVELAGADRLLGAISAFVPHFRTKQNHPRKLKFNRVMSDPAPELSHAIAACFGASLAGLFSGTNYESGMEGALKYVLGRSPRRSMFEHISRKFVFVKRGGEISLPEKSGELEDLIDAVLRHRVTKIRYEHSDKTIEKVTIKPLSIAVYDHQLYVIGRSKSSSAYPYRFSRIIDVDATELPFEYPSRAEYDPEQVFLNSFGIFISDAFKIEDVIIRVKPPWGTIAKRHRWHQSQHVDDDGDGVHSTIRMHVRVCPELVAWILGMGYAAEVLAPQSLRNDIASRIKKMSMTYRIRKAASS